MILCKNCGKEVDGKYCNECGQSAKTDRLTWKSVLESLVHGIFHMDNTFMRTTWVLIRNPQQLLTDYFAGRRKPYMAPVQFLAVWCVIAVFINNIVPVIPGTISGISISETSQWIVSHYTFVTILTIPFIVLAIKMAFYKGGSEKYNWVEYFLGCCYMWVLYLLVSILVTPFTYLDAAFFNRFIGVTMVVYLLLTFRAAFAFFPRPFWSTVWRTLLGVLIYILLTIALSFIIVLFVKGW